MNNLDNQYIKVFNTEYEQREYLSVVNENDFPLITCNKENNLVYFSSDGTLGKNLKYENENYLSFDPKYRHPEFFVIPNDVDHLTNNDENIPINLKYKKEYNTPLYTVGLMSDVHYNDTDTDMDPDTNITNDGAEYSEDLKNALQYFIDQNVDFVACCGDISSDYSDHIKNYKRCIDKYFSNLPIFTCAGNHDTKPKYKYHNLWQSVSALNNNDYEVTYFKDYEPFYDENTGDTWATESSGNGTSFYIKKFYDDTFDVYIYLNIEYGFNSTSGYDTHFKNSKRFLVQEELLVHDEVDEENDLHLYHPQTLECLAEILEEYKDHRCFIFTHPMFPDKAGNFHQSSYGNNIPYYEYAKYSNHADVLRGDQGEYIRNLMEQYDNNYWFCGHSHYKWAWETVDHDINITTTGNSCNIHLPSLSRPLPLGIYSYQNAPKDSEAAIMEVYKDYVVIKGIVFKEKDNYQNPYELIINHPYSKMEYVTSDMFAIYGANESTIEQLENNYVQINFIYNNDGSHDDNNIYLNNGLIDASNFGNYIPVLRFEDVQIWYDEMDETDTIENITRNIKAEGKIGFRDHTSTSDYYYYFTSNAIYTLYENGIIFKVSSSSQYVNYHLHFKLKFKIGFVNVGYINKFLPIACFKLPIIKKEED